MPVSMTTENHPVYVRARQAARARPEFRLASRPAAPVTRLSNAPVRVLEDASSSDAILLLASGGEETAPPIELPPRTPPVAPEPAPPEITDIPPSQVPVPTHQPPGMPPPMG